MASFSTGQLEQEPPERRVGLQLPGFEAHARRSTVRFRDPNGGPTLLTGSRTLDELSEEGSPVNRDRGKGSASNSPTRKLTASRTMSSSRFADDAADTETENEATALGTLARGAFEEAYCTVFADASIAATPIGSRLVANRSDAGCLIRNLDTGEARLIDECLNAFTHSFVEAPDLFYPRCSTMLESGSVAAQAAWRVRRDGPNRSELGKSGGPRSETLIALLLASKLGARGKACIRVLLEAQADVNLRGREGLQALHCAAGTRNAYQVLQLLLDAGADPLVQADRGDLPIHLAAFRGHWENVELLIDRGGSRQLEVRNSLGQLPQNTTEDPKVQQIFRRHLPSQIAETGGAADSFSVRTRDVAGNFRRNSRIDLVHRLLATTSALTKAQVPGPPSSDAGSWSPQSLRNRTPRSRGSRTPRPSTATTASGGHSRCSFARIKSSSTTELVGPSSFEMVKLLGRGSFGEVYKVRHKSTGKIYAMKVLQKNRLQRRKCQRYAQAERNILTYVHHPFIVSLRYAFQTTSCLVLVMQYCPNGDLQQLITKHDRLQDATAMFYTAEIILALCHLHDRRIIFRDLKPDNVVLDEEYHAELTDFGLSKESVNDKGTSTFCGSDAYLAPEVLARKSYCRAVDIYGLGVLLFNMLTGFPPYYHHDRETLFANIRHAKLEVPSYVSPLARAFIEAVLERRPERRFGAQQTSLLQAHPYFESIDFSKLFRRELAPPGRPKQRGAQSIDCDELVKSSEVKSPRKSRCRARQWLLARRQCAEEADEESNNDAMEGPASNDAFWSDDEEAVAGAARVAGTSALHQTELISAAHRRSH
eukprot:CAMPEP_0206619342 /NCGR_PEP_ID=MMETSP0325_2-20121206/60769_1 /ASSEMBLY_ACC=CAM_ASM_000347 /TAXON_ID=2866 /ORGANISM="Crypthecodinium cohnii, Strain Seligo" /LENGTH=821 /DNA_ID=CAMNT_0054141689 /DNA_START=101 /DNA_END=2565 /DNA_ORIENTATION=-